MTKEEVIEKLIEQVNQDMDIFIGILSIVLVVFLYFQWQLSEKKIKNLKLQIEKELVIKYRLQEIGQQLNQTLINDSLRYENDINTEILKLEEGLYLEEYSRQMEYAEERICINMISIINSAIDDEIKSEIYHRVYTRIERLNSEVINQKNSESWAVLFEQLLNRISKLYDSRNEHNNY